MDRLRRIAHNLIRVTVFLLGAWSVSHAQTLAIYNLDTSRFPDMEAEFVLLDATGNPIRDLSPGDFVLSEDMATVAGTFTIDCPNSAEASPIHAALVCDRSGSMLLPIPSGLDRLTLLKRGATAFVNAVRFVPPTSIAVTSFDDDATVMSYFATTAGPAVTGINAIRLGGGTNYTSAFVDPFAGGIPLLAMRAAGVKRILIFITDGVPNAMPNVSRILLEAQAADVAIYAVTLGMPMTPLLQYLADETGGKAYGDVSDEDQMRAVYTAIALNSQGVSPCKVRWRSGSGCGPNSIKRTFHMVWKPQSASATARYTAPARSVIQMQTNPEYLWFGAIGAGDSAKLPLTITPRGSAMLVTQATIPATAPFDIVDWGGTPPPFNLSDGQSRTLTIRFKPLDSSIQSTSLVFETDRCPVPPVTLSGGVTRFRDITRLKLLSPIGGEGYNGCDSIAIRWAGIEPEDPIAIEYSDNDGATWHMVAASVKGLRYTWFPPAPGTHYRIRITSASGGLADSIKTVAGGGASTAESIYAVDAQLITPTAVVSAGDFLYYSEAGRHVIRKVDLNSGLIATIAGTGVPGYSGDGGTATTARLTNPAGLALSGQYLYIADYGNHRVRRLDLGTGTINTVAGTGASGFAGDNGTGINAQLQYPADVVATPNALFISDKGNNRVRRLDFRTNVITTVAGGGFIPDGDGSPATSVALNGPQGLAFIADPANVADSLYIVEEGASRVRRVDMRTGIIVTIAGTGTAGFTGDGRSAITAQLNKPQGIAIAGDRIFISDSKNNRVRAVSRVSGIIRTVAGAGRAGFSGDNGPALSAELNAPAGLAGDAATIYIADALNDRLRAVSMGALGRTDSSAWPFIVSVGHLSITLPGKRVAFGQMALGAARDTAIVSVICNTGDIPLSIDSAAIVGGDVSDFEIVSGLSSAALPPGACIPIELRFRPSAVGARNAVIVFYGRCSGTDTLVVTGTGVQPCGIATLDHVDFGAVAVGGSKDSVVDKILCNTGAYSVSGRVALLPADGSFTVLSGGGDFTLAPGACLTVTIGFNPGRKGTTTALLDYGIPSSCGPTRTLLAGRGLTAQTISVSDLAYPAAQCWRGPRDTLLAIANAGDAPLLISDLQLLNNNEGFSIISAIPSPSAPVTVLPNDVLNVAIRFDPASLGDKSATLRILSNAATAQTDVRLSGRRDSLGASVEPASIGFDGRLPAGDYPIDSTIVIRNTGSLALSFSVAAITGADSARFAIPDGQLPLRIAPGDSAVLRVRVLGPTNGAPATATLTLALDQACDSAIRSIRLIESGALPAIVAQTPVFRAIICPDDLGRDTSITITNPGGSPLRITAAEILPAAQTAFSVTAAPPIIVMPGASIALPVRFAPSAPGAYAADLILHGNAASGDSIIHLSATRELLAFDVADADLAFGLVPAGERPHLPDAVVNTGSIGAQLSFTLASAAASPFAMSGALARTIPAGESAPLDISFSSTAPGDFADTLIVTDARCGIVRRIALSARVFEPIRTTVVLPVDSAARDVSVELPIRLRIAAIERFRQSGASGFSMRLSFSGAVLMPIGATGAVMSDVRYDSRTTRQEVTLSGSYDPAAYDPADAARGGSVLAVLRCRVPAGDSLGTPLRFETFAWDRTDVLADTVNGMFHTFGECGSALRLVSQVHVTKLRPQPAGGGEGARVEAELALEADLEVSGSLVDAAGRTVRLLPPRRYSAGTAHLLVDLSGLASGTYWLLVDSPFGSDIAPVVIAR